MTAPRPALDHLHWLYECRDHDHEEASAAVEARWRNRINVAVEAVQREALPCTNS